MYKIFVKYYLNYNNLYSNKLGGTLKTPAHADSESLQAKWVTDINELSLRGNDIYPLITRAKQYHSRTPADTWHPILHPVNKSHTKLIMKLVIAIRRKSKLVI